MLLKFITGAALLAAPAGLTAHNLNDTHEQVSVAGKSVPLMRPRALQPAARAQCHAETSKAIVCEAYKRHRLTQAVAARHKAPASEMTRR